MYHNPHKAKECPKKEGKVTTIINHMVNTDEEPV